MFVKCLMKCSFAHNHSTPLRVYKFLSFSVFHFFLIVLCCVCVCVFWQNDKVVVEDVKEDEDVDDDDGDDEDEEDGAQGCFFSSSSVCVFTTLLFDGVLFGWFEGFICAAL